MTAIVPGAAPRQAWSETDADVIVIGAGLAGLSAAMTLEAAGARVIVVEGADRIGGRLMTLDTVPGRPEAGAIQFGRGYTRAIALAERLGIARVPAAFDLTALYVVDGIAATAETWADSPANRLVGAERAVPPAALPMVFARQMPQLADAADWAGAGIALDLPYDEALRGAGASDEAVRLIDCNLNGNDIATLSALNVARGIAALRTGGTAFDLLAGGSQRLPEAMAATLREPPRLRHRVMGLAETADAVTVTLADGTRLSARHAICTIPFAALRELAIDAPLTPALRRCIAQLPYTRATFVYFEASEPFWHSDGLPPTLWSDDPLIGRVFALDGDPPLLKAWLPAAAAPHIASLSDENIGALVLSRIAAIRPAARDRLRPIHVHDWSREPLARGLYHHIPPGFAATLADAIRAPTSRLHFAGEHLSSADIGIEGAIASGMDAAGRVEAAL